MHALVLLCINQHTKFEVPSVANSKDINGVTSLFCTVFIHNKLVVANLPGRTDDSMYRASI